MPKKVKSLKPLGSGLVALDALSIDPQPNLAAYIKAVSEYVLHQKSLSASIAKRAQIALSAGLGRALKGELESRLTGVSVTAGETKVAGALRTAQADVSESHALDGLRLAVEIKPVNVAVGRAVWNRFGDVRAFAVNIHLKFPFAVVGGLMTVPTWEWKISAGVDPAGVDEPQKAEDVQDGMGMAGEIDTHAFTEESTAVAELSAAANEGQNLIKWSTVHLIERLVHRLARIRLREFEADADHLLEAVAVIVYDPDTGTEHPSLPAPGTGLRWDEFIERLAATYEQRFR